MTRSEGVPYQVRCCYIIVYIYIREGERLQSADVRAQELCESRGGRSGLVQSLIVCTISVDVKQQLKKSPELLSPSWDN